MRRPTLVATVEDRANLLGELCRTGPVGAGVLLGRQGVALSRPDRAVGQTDLDAWDALIDTDADSKHPGVFRGWLDPRQVGTGTR